MLYKIKLIALLSVVMTGFIGLIPAINIEHRADVDYSLFPMGRDRNTTEMGTWTFFLKNFSIEVGYSFGSLLSQGPSLGVGTWAKYEYDWTKAKELEKEIQEWGKKAGRSEPVILPYFEREELKLRLVVPPANWDMLGGKYTSMVEWQKWLKLLSRKETSRKIYTGISVQNKKFDNIFAGITYYDYEPAVILDTKFFVSRAWETGNVSYLAGLMMSKRFNHWNIGGGFQVRKWDGYTGIDCLTFGYGSEAVRLTAVIGVDISGKISKERVEVKRLDPHLQLNFIFKPVLY